MVIGNFHPSNSSRTFMDFWLDWVLIYRSEKELRALARELPGARVSVTSDSTGIQLFLHVGKGRSSGR
jgi:hypothetical protein